MDKTKPYEIPKRVIVEAFKRVKQNHGAAGIDGESLEMFEADLKNNLYKVWNRMSSGSYFPPPVKAVDIPKKQGGTRTLGVPTVADRVAQMVAKIYFEPTVEPHFHPDSYGYRPGRSQIDALTITRKRCWEYDWVLELDIKGLFDNIDHELLMCAVRKHTDNPWVALYIRRWLEAPFQVSDGTMKARTAGTPQGGVISPVLANLFMHYAFDMWMKRNHLDKPFARFADDAVVHCKTRKDAERVLEHLKERFRECKLELHPAKTRIVYCKDSNRKDEYPNTSFDFLGYTFRVRTAMGKYGFFTSFAPAVSQKARTAMQQEIRGWKLQLKCGMSLEDISQRFNSVIRGWINYYRHFNKTGLDCVLQHVNKALARWAKRKYRRQFAGRKHRAYDWLKTVAQRDPKLFAHWQLGILPKAG